MSTKITSSASSCYFNNGRGRHKIDGLYNLPMIKRLEKIDQPRLCLNLSTKYGISRFFVVVFFFFPHILDLYILNYLSFHWVVTIHEQNTGLCSCRAIFNPGLLHLLLQALLTPHHGNNIFPVKTKNNDHFAVIYMIVHEIMHRFSC